MKITKNNINDPIHTAKEIGAALREAMESIRKRGLINEAELKKNFWRNKWKYRIY